MLFRQEGRAAAVVGSDGKVHLQRITIGHDYGTTLEILGGVEPGGPHYHQSFRFAGRRSAGERRSREPGRPAVMKRLTLAAGILASGLLAGCAVGPNYHRPPVQAPSAYKTEGPWRVAAPKDSIPKGRVVGDLQRRRAERLRAATAPGQPVAGRSQGPSQRGALAGARDIGRIFPNVQHRSQRLATTGIQEIARKLLRWADRSRRTPSRFRFC